MDDDGDDDFWTHPINNSPEKEAFAIVIEVVVVVEEEEAEFNSKTSLIPDRKERRISQGHINSGTETR